MDFSASDDTDDEREGRRWLEAWGLSLRELLYAHGTTSLYASYALPDGATRIAPHRWNVPYSTPGEAYRALGWCLRWRRAAAGIAPPPSLVVVVPLELNKQINESRIYIDVGRVLTENGLVWPSHVWFFGATPFTALPEPGEVLLTAFTGVYYYDLVFRAAHTLVWDLELVLALDDGPEEEREEPP